MVDSGIKVHNDAVAAFASFENDSKRIYDYVILKIDKVNKVDIVVVEEAAEVGSCATKFEGQDLKGIPPRWYGFQEALKERAARFGVGYCDFTTKDGRASNKLVYVYWCPDHTKVGDKMKYSSTKQNVKKKVKNAGLSLECSDHDEISYLEVVHKASKGDFKI